MANVTFTSRYFGAQVSVRLTRSSSALINNKHHQPMEMYIYDCELMQEGKDTIVFSKHQLKKIKKALAEGDVWLSLEVK